LRPNSKPASTVGMEVWLPERSLKGDRSEWDV
jgi:hypothetical protein